MTWRGRLAIAAPLIAALIALIAVEAGELQWYACPFKLSDGAGGYYYRDTPTQVHEDTHGVNSLLRNRYGGACFYVGHERFVRFENVRGLTLEHVAQACRYRGRVYPDLIDGQPWWNDKPFYVFDEWVCYSNEAAFVMWGPPQRDREWAIILHALEYAYYSRVLVAILPADYPDRRQVAEFWRWNAARVLRIADQAERERKHFDKRQTPWRTWLRKQLESE